MPKLSQLSIVVTRPNPDDFGDADEEVAERLGRLKAKRMTTTFDSEKGETLAPDDETRKLAHAALSNGRVVAKVKDEHNKTITVSTQSHPHRHVDTYREDEVKDSAFARIARKAVALIRRNVP